VLIIVIDIVFINKVIVQVRQKSEFETRSPGAQDLSLGPTHLWGLQCVQSIQLHLWHLALCLAESSVLIFFKLTVVSSVFRNTATLTSFSPRQRKTRALKKRQRKTAE
jgi:hypothetical protein